MSVARRLLVYLVTGVLLVVAGLAVLVWGEWRGDSALKLAGLALCVASMPLLLQAKLTRMESRIGSLERRLATNSRPRFDGPRYSGDEDEDEAEETDA